MRWFHRSWPVFAVTGLLILLGYPLALLFGLPLARRDMQDLRKWEKATVVAAPLENPSATRTISFPRTPERGVLVRDERPLEHPYTQDGNTVTLEVDLPLVEWGETLESLSPTVYRFSDAIPELDATRALYAGDRLLLEGAVIPRQLPDGQRLDFIFSVEEGAILLNSTLLSEGTNYTADGRDVLFTTPPPFGSSLRRISADYAVLDAAAGTLAFTTPPAAPVRAASSVVRLAERLEGVTDGSNRSFRFEVTNVFDNDRERAVFLDTLRLSDLPERPAERVDGQNANFTFPSTTGIVVLDGVALSEGRDYSRDGTMVLFSQPSIMPP